MHDANEKKGTPKGSWVRRLVLVGSASDPIWHEVRMILEEVIGGVFEILGPLRKWQWPTIGTLRFKVDPLHNEPFDPKVILPVEDMKVGTVTVLTRVALLTTPRAKVEVVTLVGRLFATIMVIGRAKRASVVLLPALEGDVPRVNATEPVPAGLIPRAASIIGTLMVAFHCVDSGCVEKIGP